LITRPGAAIIPAVGDEMADSSDHDQATGLRRGSIATAGVFGQSLAVGPIFSAGFLSGTVAAFAGFNTPLSVLLAAIGAVALAYVLTLFGCRFAGAGAVYEYLARGVHSSLGIVAAGAYVAGLMFLGAGGGFVAEGYLANRLAVSQLHVGVGWWVWALVALAAAVAINYRGVRVGIWVVVGAATIALVPFLVIAIAIVAQGGAAGNSLAVFDPSQTSWNATFHGILFAISLFIGFETVAALGEETRRPRRSIPAVLVASIGLCTLFYLLVTYAGAIGFSRGELARNAWFDSGNPFGVLGQRYVAKPFEWIINLTIVIDLFSVCVAFTLAASRILMALARDRLLPEPVARTSTRFRSPVGGLAVIAGWSLLVIVWAGVAHYGAAVHTPDVLETVLILSTTGTYLITAIYLVLAAGSVWLLRDEFVRGRLWRKVPLVAVAIAVPLLSFDGSLNPFPSYPARLAVYFAAVTVAVAFGWYLALLRWRPERVGAAASHAEAAATVPMPTAAHVER
jgi:amino acid transporter